MLMDLEQVFGRNYDPAKVKIILSARDESYEVCGQCGQPLTNGVCDKLFPRRKDEKD